MSCINRSKKIKFLLSLAVLYVVSCGTQVYINASTSSSDLAKVSILPGPLFLDYSQEVTFLDYNDKRFAYIGTIGDLFITDATGSGLGWHVDVTTDPVKATTKSGEIYYPNHTFRLYKNGVKISCNGGKLPHLFSGNYIELDSSDSKTILIANPSEGMGKCDVNFPGDSLYFLMDKNKVEHTYETNVTISITQGP